MSEKEKSLVSEETKTESKIKKQKTKVKKPSKIKKWFKDLKSEINKIVWPTKKHVRHNTSVVLVTVVLALAIIVGLDFVFQFISDALITLG